MLIDSKGKLFGKISIVDILIVVMIVGVIGGVGYKFTKSRTSTPFAKKDTIKVTFYSPEVDSFMPEKIKVGDIVTDSTTSAVFGKVVSVKFDKAISYGTDNEGRWVQSSKPNYLSLILEVEGQGIYNNRINGQGVSFGNIDYFVMKELGLKVGEVSFWTKIKSFEKKE